MAVYWVNYDLNASGQDYEKVIEYLKSHETWAKPLKSSFLVKTNLTPAELCTGARQHMDANDAILVMQVDGANWAALGVPKEVTDWLRAHVAS